ncbi:DUF7446 family protein [Proteus mirabilis]|uniref:DUF7446 family protein n=1 Tax=Proteus mirabilis TaxID=584 RepID=UPI00126219DA|nr:hypothetical protein [Proteus mirabilis]KAB7730798.1 hypothetical protein GBN10_01420 [Proteus mirabilis]
MANTARLRLGFSPLTKKISLAKMKVVGDGLLVMVGNDERDVTNEAAQMVWQLVIAEGGEIKWHREDGKIMKLKAELIDDDNSQGCNEEE